MQRYIIFFMFYLFYYYYHHHHHYYYFVDRHLNVVIPAVLGYPCILYSIICRMIMLCRVRPFSIHPSKLISKDNLINTPTKYYQTIIYTLILYIEHANNAVLECPGVSWGNQTDRCTTTLQTAIEFYISRSGSGWISR